MRRRTFLQSSSALAGTAMLGGLPGGAGAQTAGGVVEKRSLITATAQLDPARPEIARLIAQACQKIGFNCEANPMDYNQGIQKVVMEHDYEMFLVILAGSPIRIDPQVFIYGMHHSGEHRRGGFNWMGYANPKLDALAVQQEGMLDLEKRKAPVFEAQQMIYDDQPGTIVAYPQLPMAHRSDKVKGLVPQLGEGIGSFWSDIGMEPIGGDGYVVTGHNADVKHLNPISANDIFEFYEIGMIYDRLMRIGPDGKPTLWAAKSVTAADDKTIDVTIRSGMKWHDGKPVTAEDVKFTFDYHLAQKAPFFLAYLRNIEAVDVTGADSVRFRLTKPFAPILSTVLAGVFLIPKHVWERIPGGGVDDALKFANENPIGSGPFKFDHWRRGQELKVSANKEHFSPPKCAGNLRVVYGSHDAMAAALEKGECHRTRYAIGASHVDQLKGKPNIVAKGYPTHGFYHLAYNNKIAPFNNPAFRQALNLVIPRQQISELVLLGYAEPGASVISPANAFWHNPAVKAPAEDTKKARDILQKAGFTWDGQGKLKYPA
ncbi:MAG: twin-arginine translocation pathway signal protein [Alphaproteobacteria bacterium]|nr:twin-arginine translocation pathway signal protein [Alphaproteobacteria bacterium]